MRPVYHIDQDQRVRDCDAVPDIIASGRNTTLVAPPGTGKTEATVAALKASGTPFVYVASVKPQADEIGQTYGLPVHHKDTGYDTGPQVVTIPLHLPRYADRGRVLVVEGLQWMVSEYDFRPEHVDNVLRHVHSDSFEQVVVLDDLTTTADNGTALRLILQPQL
jgi:hypothetical protein